VGNAGILRKVLNDCRKSLFPSAGTRAPDGPETQAQGYLRDYFPIPAVADHDRWGKDTKPLSIPESPEKALVPKAADRFSAFLQMLSQSIFVDYLQPDGRKVYAGHHISQRDQELFLQGANLIFGHMLNLPTRLGNRFWEYLV
jgi:hypothetical protein